MELVAIVRILWQRRAIVAIGVALAVPAGVLAARHADRQASGSVTGVSLQRVVLDTTRSQLIGADPKGASTLPTRAALLADAASTKAGTRLVSRAAGARQDQVAVLGPAVTRIPVVDSPLVTRAFAAGSAVLAPYVVELFADGKTPIVTVRGHAPSAAESARLTRAAVSALRSLLVLKDGTHSRGFVFERVTPVVTRRLSSHSHARIAMAGAALAAFASWCVCVVVAASVAGRRGVSGSSGDRATTATSAAMYMKT